MTTAIKPPFPVFYDTDGKPLENGSIYIGQAGLNPETNPLPVFFDEELTIPGSQPLSTIAGYVTRNNSSSGTPVVPYVDDSDYSIIVRNKLGELVYSSLNNKSTNGTGFVIVESIAEMQALSTTNATSVYLKQNGRGGIFDWNSNDLTTRVTNDPFQGVYVAPNSDLSGASGAWVRKDRYVVYPDYFGATRNTLSPQDAEVDAWINYISTYTDTTGKWRGWYGITSDKQVAASRVTIAATGTNSENAISYGLYKLNGFSGAQGLKIGDGVTTYLGISISDTCVWGNNQQGHGIVFENLSKGTFNNIFSERNDGWGMVRNGLFACVFNYRSTRFNGVSTVSGGGCLDQFSIRETANMVEIDAFSNNNFNSQDVWDVSTSNTQRMVSYTGLGGICELPADDTAPVAVYKSADRCTFYNKRLPNVTNNVQPCVRIGNATSVLPIRDLTFSECYFQHTSAGSNFAIDYQDNVTNVTFVNPVRGGTDKLMDASGISAGNGRITIIGGNVPADQYNDPNELIASVTPDDAVVGLRPGSVGDKFFVNVRELDRPIWLQVRDAASSNRILKLGDGNSNDRLVFENIYPVWRFYSTAPSNPVAGMIAASDGTGGGFDGVSGEGLYIRNRSNTAWNFIISTT